MIGDLAVAGKALAAVGAQLREGEAGDAIGGVVPAFAASPGSTSEAAAVLRVAAEHELAVVPRGSGSRLGWGVPPSRCDLVVDTLGMDAVVEHAAGDLVARVQAGARMGDVARLLAAAGQEIALDVPAGATVGGVVASGLAGPRRLRYGSPRDLLIGITVVRADGTVASSPTRRSGCTRWRKRGRSWWRSSVPRRPRLTLWPRLRTPSLSRRRWS